MAANDIEGAPEYNSINSEEECWHVLQLGIEKAIGIAEGVHHQMFSANELMGLYTIVYDIASQKNAVGEKRLYELYQKTSQDYVCSKVLPHLRGKKGEILLKELVQKWDKYRVLQKRIQYFFSYLDRSFLSRSRPSLRGTSQLVFYELVYGEMNDQVKDAVISMINREREGEQIDQPLVKTVLEIYVEMAEDSMKYYEKDFETTMLTDTAQFYSQKASDWLRTHSYNTYMLKVGDCIIEEEARARAYMSRSINKSAEVVARELLAKHASKLEEMKQIEEKAA